MRKVPTITLSITYKGVKFIDASNKVRSPCPAALFLSIPTHTPILATHWSPPCVSSQRGLPRPLACSRAFVVGVPY